MPTRIVSLFRNLLRKSTVEQALDDELQSSVELLAEEKMKEGLAHSEARRQALLELGGVEQVKEGVRGIRAGRLLEDLAKDVRYGPTAIAPEPGFHNGGCSHAGAWNRSDDRDLQHRECGSF